MKENDLFEIIGDIDDEQIEEAYNLKPKNKKFAFVRKLSFAACFVLVVAVSFSVVNEETPPKDSVTAKPQKGGGEITNQTPPTDGNTEMNNETEALADTERKEVINDVMKPNSLLDEDGIVTEDAANEESSDYTSGGGESSGGSASLKKEFPLDYLILLNEKITAQAAKGDFPFMISSFVNENTNRVEVLVTSMDKDLIDRIKALDTKGGAIEFKLNTKIIELQ